MTIRVRGIQAKHTSSKQPSNLSIYMPKRAGDWGQPLLTPILKSIYFDETSVFLILEVRFSYNLMAISLNSKGTFGSSNIFQCLVFDTLSNALLKSMKKHKIFILLL